MFAHVNINYLHEQRFHDQTFIIIVLKNKSACRLEVLLICTISNPFGRHTASNPPKQAGIQGKQYLMSEKLKGCFPLRYANKMKLF